MVALDCPGVIPES